MIIMADTYEEFLQMLGRKRMLNNVDTLNVYFLKRNAGDFIQKLKGINEELKFINRHRSRPISLYEMMESESCYFCTRRAYYLLEFSLKLNKFAFEQYRYLQGQYQKIIKRFEEEDSSAFLREQIEWLGRKSNEIDDITKEEADRLIERVSKILEDVVGKVLTKKENLELRDNIREDLKELLTITLENSQDIKLKKELRAQIGEFGKSSISKKDNPSIRPWIFIRILQSRERPKQ